MLSTISAGFVMGFSTSLICLGTCMPILAPYTVMGEKPSILSGLFSAFLFSVGRFIAYVILLALFIILNETVFLSPVVLSGATMVSGIILVLSGLAAFGLFNQPNAISRILCKHMAGTSSPLYLGLLAGIRPCGPLLAAMAFMLTLPGIGDLSVFILVFWLASSLLLLAVGAAGGGLATIFGRRIGIERMRRIAGMAMVVIGSYMLIRAIGLLVY